MQLPAGHEEWLYPVVELEGPIWEATRTTATATAIAHTTSATVEAEAGCSESVVKGRGSVVQRCRMRTRRVEAKRSAARGILIALLEM